MKSTQIVLLGKKALAAWVADYAPSMGAALAYYTLFSIAPLLLLVIAIAGLVFGEAAVRGQIFGELHGLLGETGAAAVQGLLQDVAQPAQGIAAAVAGVIAMLIGAMSVFGELQDALDRIWRAPTPPGGSSLLRLLRARLLSFGMILAIGFLLIVSMVLGAALTALGKWWAPAFGSWSSLAVAVELVLGFGVVTVAFALIYKILPRVRIEWRDVWIGAAVTALLFTAGKFLIGLYLGRATFASAFGAAGSVVVLLVWMYYSAQIFLLGAEFTWVYAHEFGSRCPRSLPTGGTPPPLGAAGAALATTREALRAELGRRAPGASAK